MAVLFVAGAVISGYFRPSFVRSIALVTIGVSAGLIVGLLWRASEARDKRLESLSKKRVDQPPQ